MAYEYTERQLQQWDWPAQAAAWKERAEHEASRARYWKRRYESLTPASELNPGNHQ